MYQKDKAENAYEILRFLTGQSVISAELWNSLIEDARKTRAYIEEQVYITKAKDYTNSFRGITYRNDAERDAVLGKVEDNSFIKIANKDTAAFNAMLDAVRG